jgi:hypothetical protein
MVARKQGEGKHRKGKIYLLKTYTPKKGFDIFLQFEVIRFHKIISIFCDFSQNMILLTVSA